MIGFQRFFILCTVAILTGCAANGPAFQEQTATEVDDGTVYFYRVYSSLGAAGSPYLYINGKYKGKLKPGGYLYLHLPEGSYEVTLGSIDGPDSNWNWAPDPFVLPLHIKAGKPQFYKMIMLFGDDGPTIQVAGNIVVPVQGSTATVILEEVDKIRALEEIKDTKLSN
ncbi:DUF2846 domain-containing protein [Kangiella sp.]|uniref:DUF2846 domain-containing protein n=1 Tax=Kangiella sp. TaxID=1920245 RepID=UPI003A91F071